MKSITVNDNMQTKYTYVCTEKPGRNFRVDFTPDLTPKQMLELGVFDGAYLEDCQDEFPKSWFISARLAHGKPDPECNFYQIHASQSLQEWQRKGWIYDDDPRGWFQWYCRYYMGRRLLDEDDRQIKRWKQMTRHVGQIKKHCHPGDILCRRKQRQALLHWAYDSRLM